jgi:hypothetical protein
MTPAQSANTESVLECQRDAFDVPDEVAYFNTANLAPHLRSVRAGAKTRWRSAGGHGRSARKLGLPTLSGSARSSEA